MIQTSLERTLEVLSFHERKERRLLEQERNEVIDALLRKSDEIASVGKSEKQYIVNEGKIKEKYK